MGLVGKSSATCSVLRGPLCCLLGSGMQIHWPCDSQKPPDPSGQGGPGLSLCPPPWPLSVAVPLPSDDTRAVPPAVPSPGGVLG